jgi:hypothetical protein
VCMILCLLDINSVVNLGFNNSRGEWDEACAWEGFGDEIRHYFLVPIRHLHSPSISSSLEFVDGKWFSRFFVSPGAHHH